MPGFRRRNWQIKSLSVCAELKGTEQQRITEGQKEQCNDEILEPRGEELRRMSLQRGFQRGFVSQLSTHSTHRGRVNMHRSLQSIIFSSHKSQENVMSDTHFGLAQMDITQMRQKMLLFILWMWLLKNRRPQYTFLELALYWAVCGSVYEC